MRWVRICYWKFLIPTFSHEKSNFINRGGLLTGGGGYRAAHPRLGHALRSVSLCFSLLPFTWVAVRLRPHRAATQFQDNKTKTPGHRTQHLSSFRVTSDWVRPNTHQTATQFPHYKRTGDFATGEEIMLNDRKPKENITHILHFRSLGTRPWAECRRLDTLHPPPIPYPGPKPASSWHCLLWVQFWFFWTNWYRNLPFCARRTWVSFWNAFLTKFDGVTYLAMAFSHDIPREKSALAFRSDANKKALQNAWFFVHVFRFVFVYLWA